MYCNGFVCECFFCCGVCIMMHDLHYTLVFSFFLMNIDAAKRVSDLYEVVYLLFSRFIQRIVINFTDL